MYKFISIVFLVLSSNVFANKLGTDDKLTVCLEKYGYSKISKLWP
jgi:hypothetical protein